MLLKKILSHLYLNNFDFVDFFSNNDDYCRLFNFFKLLKKNNYENFLISRLTPLLKEDFKMSFYYKTLKKLNNKINLTKSDIDGDVPEFI